MISSERQKQIINILISKNKIVKGEDLCTTIGVSSRTIRSDIKELNDVLKKHGAFILSEKGKGYSIEITDKDDFKQFLDFLKVDEKGGYINLTIKERAEYIVMKLLLNDIKGLDGVTQIDLADELFISLSSLKNDIKLSKTILSEIKLDIVKNKNKGIIISGKEDDIRKCISIYLKAYNKFFFDEFKKIFQEKVGNDTLLIIENILKENLLKYKLRLTDIAFSNLLNLTYIMIIRSLMGKHINYTEEIISSLNKESKIEIAENICSDLEEKLKIKLEVCGVYYITQYIISSNLIITEVEKYKLTNEEANYNLINEILKEIYQVYYIDLSKDDILRSFLGSHLSASINRAKYEIKIENNMLSTIKNNYPFAFELGVLANKIISKSIGISLSEDDIGFLTLHFAASLERMKGKKGKVKRVILVCTTGVGTSLLLKVKLGDRFKDKLDIVDTIPWYEFNENLFENVDLIITTIPLGIESKKVIYVKNLLDKNEVKLIEESIYNTNLDGKNILDIFKEELFIKSVDAANKYDVLEMMTNHLIDLSYIKENVKDEIFKREELASTEIGDLVAIPHTMQEGIEKSFISVAILKKSITWEKEKVQIVFMVGIAQKDQQLLKSILEQIYKKIIDSDLILELIKVNSFNEFIKVFN
ncbi:BglG family transcription antiterminator [Clostridium sp. MB05]|jgi:lichenan operon transcriptional antiterminator